MGDRLIKIDTHHIKNLIKNLIPSLLDDVEIVAVYNPLREHYNYDTRVVHVYVRHHSFSEVRPGDIVPEIKTNEK